MDVTEQVKKDLISRIETSGDLNFLLALQTLLDTSENSLYQLSDEQQKQIVIGRTEIKNGESIENGQLISEMKEWLTKK